MRAALYARVSRTVQDEALQLAELRRLAQTRGWTVVSEYIDHGVSGKKEVRPALDRMLADVQAGRLDVVATWRLDRIGRSLSHLVLLLDTLSAAGVAFVAARNQGIDTTSPLGKALMLLIAAFAEMEHDAIRERVKAGIEVSRAAGKAHGRPRVALPSDEAIAAALHKAGSARGAARLLNLDATTFRRALDAQKGSSDG